MDFKALLNTSEYDFLRTNPRLGSRIMLLGVSGSHGYGTNREGSDIDFRGVTLNLPSDLIGLTSFDQYEDQYVIKTAAGQELLDHRQLFLSKRAAASFGHYADAQLRRLQNAIARDTLPQPSREEHILKSVNHALDDFNRRQQHEYKTGAKLYIDTAETEGLETEIFLDADFRHYPLRRYNDMMNTLHTVVRDYDKIGKRNHKKDDNHLNKHAMHLVRLFMMGIDILEKGEIRTHRPETDLELLRSIRNGEYMQESILTPAFYEIVTDYEQHFHEAEARSILPDNPDMKAVGAFVESINRRVVTGEIG